jgi:DNA-directed RNA polymerase specialized sigma24 family protein
VEAHHATKYPFEIVEAVRYAREVERRSVKWIATHYDIPIDTIRDWLYRGRRTNS